MDFFPPTIGSTAHVLPRGYFVSSYWRRTGCFLLLREVDSVDLPAGRRPRQLVLGILICPGTLSNSASPCRRLCSFSQRGGGRWGGQIFHFFGMPAASSAARIMPVRVRVCVRLSASPVPTTTYLVGGGGVKVVLGGVRSRSPPRRRRRPARNLWEGRVRVTAMKVDALLQGCCGRHRTYLSDCECDAMSHVCQSHVLGGQSHVRTGAYGTIPCWHCRTTPVVSRFRHVSCYSLFKGREGDTLFGDGADDADDASSSSSSSSPPSEKSTGKQPSSEERNRKSRQVNADNVLLDPPSSTTSNKTKQKTKTKKKKKAKKRYVVQTEQWRTAFPVEDAVGRVVKPPAMKLDDDAVPCNNCGGTGMATCERCDGWGRKPELAQRAMLTLPPEWCAGCRARGWTTCARCMGTGKQREPMGFRVPE
ncbi:hypothetical protein NFJ02_41g107580 [Pycnococcus provasolii]